MKIMVRVTQVITFDDDDIEGCDTIEQKLEKAVEMASSEIEEASASDFEYETIVEV